MTQQFENASVLFPRLSILQSISNLSLVSVSEKLIAGRREEMLLDFGATRVILTANEEEDSLELRATQDADASGFVDVSRSDPWNQFVGRKFDAGWLTINQQGAWDGLLLSFGAETPQIMLHVIDTSIRIGVIG